jgi:hypothetical protein
MAKRFEVQMKYEEKIQLFFKCQLQVVFSMLSAILQSHTLHKDFLKITYMLNCLETLLRDMSSKNTAIARIEFLMIWEE